MFVTIELKKVLSWCAMMLAVLIPAGLYFVLYEPPMETLETASWGLSFQEPGQPPVANASSSALEAYDARYIGDTGEKVIYLTFDCGYENGNTGAILDALKAHNAPAAFFVVGHFAESAPELLQRMAEEGHIVGNHTYNHPDMSGVTDKTVFLQQMQKVEDVYFAATGQRMPKYYRPPQGCYSSENLALAKECGYKTAFWSLAYVDWNQDDQPATEEAMKTLTKRIHNGAVLLLHNTSSTNAAILDDLLSAYEAMGYRFGTLDELFTD